LISALSHATSAGALRGAPMPVTALAPNPAPSRRNTSFGARPCSIPVSEGSASPMRRERWPRAAIAATRARLT
jgi:hypothetical protein